MPSIALSGFGWADMAIGGPLAKTRRHPPSLMNDGFSDTTNRPRKAPMAELKLRRINELNQRLQEDLNRRRIPVSEAAMEWVTTVTGKEYSADINLPASSHSPTRSQQMGSSE